MDMRVGPQRRLRAKELMILKCGDFKMLEKTRQSLGLQGEQTSPSERKSTLNIHWKD